MRILIADDDELPRLVLQRQLEKWGYAVTAVPDGAAAWQRLQAETYDIVITDWLMPELDGPALIRNIRKQEREGYTYLILLTAKNETADLVVGMESGADDFLAKPLVTDELRVRLRAGQRIVELERHLAEKNQLLRLSNDELAAANEKMKRDLDAAAQVQQAFLPAQLPELPAVEFAWAFHPCDELAGDMLNFVPLGDDRIGLFVLDVMGHGVPAALISVAVNRLLTNLERADGQLVGAASATTNRLNAQFGEIGNGRGFVTLIYGVLDLRCRKFHYVTAGHPGPLLIPKQGSPVLPETIGIPIGVDETFTYSERTVDLQQGDRLYLFSDGLIEAANAEQEQFGVDRFQECLAAGSQQPLVSTLDAVVHQAQSWTLASRFDDDVSILAVELR